MKSFRVFLCVVLLSVFLFGCGGSGGDGSDGTPGSVVTIGNNGNWYIDGVDTGTPAQGSAGPIGATGSIGATGAIGATGPKGDNGSIGSTLEICPNGNWCINSVDTGISAQGAK